MIAREAVLDRARHADLDPSGDKLDRLHAKALIADSVPIAGTATRGYTENQAEDILAALRIGKGLGSKRPRAAEIAFWLAYEGRPAPPLLVLEHLRRSIKIFQSRTLRELNRLGAGNLAYVGAEPLTPFVAKKFTPTPLRYSLIGEIRKLAVGALLRALLQDLPFDSFRSFWRTTALFIPAMRKPTDQGLHTIWSALMEGMGLVRLDERNVLIGAIEEVTHETPQIVLPAAADTRRLREAAARVLPWLLSAETAKPMFGEDPAQYRFVDRYMPPMICAGLLLERNNEFTRGFLERIRKGDSTEIEQDLKQMNDLAQSFRALQADVDTSA